MKTMSSYFQSSPWLWPLWLTLACFFTFATFAPIFAFGMPLIAHFDGQWYFPLARYLFYKEAFTKPIDLFFNTWMVLLPFVLWLLYKRANLKAWLGLTLAFLSLLCSVFSGVFKDPSADSRLQKTRQKHIERHGSTQSWEDELKWMNDYAKLKLAWQHLRVQKEHTKLKNLLHHETHNELLTPWQIQKLRFENQISQLEDGDPYRSYLVQRQGWIESAAQKITWHLPALLCSYFWEENTGKDQKLNPILPWYERSRVNRTDLMGGLIYGSRICIVVGVLSVGISLLIGIPLGSISGYLGGLFDLSLMRLIELWEAFPTFFMLLFITAMAQSKSILLVVTILGLFSWTSFARFIRAEVIRQKALPYTEACRSQGLSGSRILFSQILPNAISPILTLLPFAIMSAISSEAGLSFLGLGEEGSCSWGTLMDEGRISFPAESYLLWPPAIALSILLISIAIIGDSLRDWLDPKLKE